MCRYSAIGSQDSPHPIHTTHLAEFNPDEYVVRNVKSLLRIWVGIWAVEKLEIYLIENLLAET